MVYGRSGIRGQQDIRRWKGVGRWRRGRVRVGVQAHDWLDEGGGEQALCGVGVQVCIPAQMEPNPMQESEEESVADALIRQGACGGTRRREYAATWALGPPFILKVKPLISPYERLTPPPAAGSLRCSPVYRSPTPWMSTQIFRPRVSTHVKWLNAWEGGAGLRTEMGRLQRPYTGLPDMPMPSNGTYGTCWDRAHSIPPQPHCRSPPPLPRPRPRGPAPAAPAACSSARRPP